MSEVDFVLSGSTEDGCSLSPATYTFNCLDQVILLIWKAENANSRYSFGKVILKLMKCSILIDNMNLAVTDSTIVVF